MYISSGCISGWQATETAINQCELQGIAITLRSTGIPLIIPSFTNSLKVAELPSVGDNVRNSDDYYLSDPTDILLCASVNALDNGEVSATQYEVPASFTGWVDHGTVSAVGLRLGVATNEVISEYPENATFEQNFNGEDSLTVIKHYYGFTGEINVVGSGTKVLGFNTGTLVVPFHASTIVGDYVLVVLMTELNVNTPTGWLVDHYDKIKGSLVNLSPLKRNTSLIIYRKKVTVEDISAGSVTISTIGS